MNKITEIQKEMYSSGKKIENHFISLAEKEGYYCLTSNQTQDRDEHWDVLLIKDNIKEYVDVKGRKYVENLGFTWIELQNVNGNVGWLYAKKLDSIVFETKESFDFVDVNDLRELMDKNIINKNGLVFIKPKNIVEMKYMKYRRSGREDIVVLTPLSDINDLIHKKIFK